MGRGCLSLPLGRACRGAGDPAHGAEIIPCSSPADEIQCFATVKISQSSLCFHVRSSAGAGDLWLRGRGSILLSWGLKSRLTTASPLLDRAGSESRDQLTEGDIFTWLYPPLSHALPPLKAAISRARCRICHVHLRSWHLPKTCTCTFLLREHAG